MSATERLFFDTNVILYLLSNDAGKADRAEALLAEGGIVSVQVLNEFAAVASRKRKLTWREIHEFLATIRMLCDVEDITLATHDAGLDFAERLGFSLYDAMIVAAAQQAGCALLYSEDMQHGQKIEGLTIRNPFRD